MNIAYDKNIAYENSPNPNNGDYPTCVIVHFPGYTGPIWDFRNPKHVPIPVVHQRCNFHCCSTSFIPLRLSYATLLKDVPQDTILPSHPLLCKFNHSIQPATHHKCIHCDSHHSVQPGTLYKCISLAKTLGNKEGAYSSLYIIGDINHTLATTLSNNENIHILKKKWMQHLQEANDKTKTLFDIPECEVNGILQSFAMHQYSPTFISESVKLYCATLTNEQYQSKSNMRCIIEP